MNIFASVKALVDYALREGLIEKEDVVFSINSVCQALNIDTFEDCEVEGEPALEEILSSILDYAVENGLCEDSVVYKDLFDTKIMGILTPRPSDVIRKFNEKYKESPKAATEYYYHLS